MDCHECFSLCYDNFMEYTMLKIKVNKEDLERTEAVLIENGFSSMMIDDPDDVRDIAAHKDTYRYDYLNEALVADLERRPEITLFFAEDEEGRAERSRAEELLKAVNEMPDAPELSIEADSAGDDADWLYKWQEFFKPTKVGEHIVVKPSWENYEPAAGELVIEMDPGMAFGSGLHETTSMCIRALEECLKKLSNDDGIRVLDVGTGTGILAIAAVKLGAAEALGIDIDTDAVRVAEENIAHNGLSDKIIAQYGDLTEGVSYNADIIVANLMADLVIRLSPAAAEHLRDGVWYITSGILDIREESVREEIQKAGFTIEQVLHDGEWCAVIARKYNR